MQAGWSAVLKLGEHGGSDGALVDIVVVGGVGQSSQLGALGLIDDVVVPFPPPSAVDKFSFAVRDLGEQVALGAV